MKHIRKQYYYYSVILSILLIFLVFNVLSLIKNQNKMMYHVLQKQAKIFANNLEDEFFSFQKEVTYLSNSEKLELLIEEDEVDQRLINRLKLFFEKYHEYVHSIVINNNNVQRFYIRDKGNYYKLSPIRNLSNFIPRMKYVNYINYDHQFVEIIIPLKNKENEVIANFKVIVVVKDYIASKLQKYYIGENSWYFLMNNEGKLNTVFHDENEIPADQIEIKKYKIIRMAIDSGLEGYIDHQVIVGDKRYSLLSGYSNINIFDQKYGVIISVPKKKIINPVIMNVALFSLIIILLISVFLMIFKLFTIKVKKFKIETIQSEHNFRSMINELPVGIICYKEDEEITVFNEYAQKMFSILNTDSIIGSKIESLSDSNLIFTLRFNIENNQQFSKLCLIQHQEKRYFMKTVIKQYIGNEINNIVILLDISEQEKALVTAQEANKAKIEFLSIISHEIRTPLSTIKGFSNLLEKKELDEESRYFNQHILNASDQLLKVINNIIELSKLESGQVSLNLLPMDLKLLINDIRKNYLSSHDIDFQIEIPENLPIVYGDMNKIKVIVSKLLDNSFKFTKNGNVKFILSLTEQENDHVNIKFSFRDTGIGIPDNKKNSIFEPFVQADGSFTREYNGIGLGLAIASKLAKLMKSYIFLDSTSEKGSSFSFSLNLRKFMEEKEHE